MADRQKAIDTLRREQCSLVVANGGSTAIFRRRGVRDLLDILTKEPALLRGAFVADKVVGKGAAALMVEGGVSGLYAEVISRPALQMLRNAGVSVSFGLCVPNIINREGTGICPVERLCEPCQTAAECIPLIRQFVNNQTSK